MHAVDAKLNKLFDLNMPLPLQYLQFCHGRILDTTLLVIFNFEKAQIIETSISLSLLMTMTTSIWSSDVSNICAFMVATGKSFLPSAVMQ